VSHISPQLSALIAHARAELRWHRRSVTTALVVVAALVAINSAHANGRREQVLVATHDLSAGAALRASDLRTESRNATEIPDGALRAPPGDARTVALPIRRGEIITDVRLLGTGLLAGLGTDVVAVPVHLSDAATADLARVGDSVDVLAAGDAGSAVLAARDAVVLRSASHPSGALGRSDAGGVVVLGVTSSDAFALARAAVASQLTLVLHSGRDP